MTILSARALVKTYQMGDSLVRALDTVSLEIAEGEMVAVTGQSGSGKSTLMNIFGCLDRPDSGEYFLAGEDVAGLTDDELAEIRNRRIGFIFQTFNLLPRMNALENVELPLLYSASKDPEAPAIEALKLVGLADRMDHEPNQLSGGQRQRVAIARALVTSPTILLADEPTGNLDSKTGEEIMALFQTLHAQGKTIIVVTHEDHIAAYCQKKIKMKDGKIENIQ
ncbi:ABC transporter ATP-binding protein [Candidatus Riflebacteria bacterium]